MPYSGLEEIPRSMEDKEQKEEQEELFQKLVSQRLSGERERERVERKAMLDTKLTRFMFSRNES